MAANRKHTKKMWHVQKTLNYAVNQKAAVVRIQEGLAVASTARDDPFTLPGDDPFPRAHLTISSSELAPACTATAMRGKLGSEYET